MTFRRLDAELTLDSTPYAASLRAASVQTRTFSAEAVAAGKEIQGGYEGATTGAKTYAAVVAESATANVEARVKEGASLVALRAEYAAIADAAVKGSAEQIAANKLVEESNVKLAASGVEVAASQGLMSGVGEKLGGVFEQLGLRVERSHGLVGAALKGMTSDMSTMGVGVGAAVGVVGAAFGVLAIEGVKHFQEVTGEIRQFQRIAGTSAQDSSALVYAFKELGIAPEVAAKSIGLFSRNLVDHADKVEAAGVAIAHLKNGNVDTIGSLFNLADAFQRVGPGAEGTTLALDLLGRGGAALIPVLQRGREGLREFFAEASAHGLIFSQKDIDDGKALTLATRDLHEAFSGFEISLARDVIPQLTSLAHGFSAVTDAVTNMHIPVVPLLEAGAAAYTASKAMVALGAGLS
ncbi:MAG: hypothetical protein QOD63_2204, partial [Actinomycetota bacterium]|nr:hypothetical protein [Actinomycetota bacterium]